MGLSVWKRRGPDTSASGRAKRCHLSKSIFLMPWRSTVRWMWRSVKYNGESEKSIRRFVRNPWKKEQSSGQECLWHVNLNFQELWLAMWSGSIWRVLTPLRVKDKTEIFCPSGRRLYPWERHSYVRKDNKLLIQWRHDCSISIVLWLRR